MYDISCPAGHARIAKGIYDRQIDTALFKRLHATNFTLASRRHVKILGPGSYNPMTIEEIYRRKSCSKYGRYYQQSQRFLSKNRKGKHLCRGQEISNGLWNIPDELRQKREFQRRFNALRLDRQSRDTCRRRRELAPRAPPVTLYEKSSFVDELRQKQTGIYGPYVKLAQDRSIPFPDWYKGPARLQDKAPPSILESLFSQPNRYKGKFLPLPSHLNRKIPTHTQFPPGPTTYFSHSLTPIHPDRHRTPGFLSSTERFPKMTTPLFHLGPASYKPHSCPPSCSSKKKQIN